MATFGWRRTVMIGNYLNIISSLLTALLEYTSHTTFLICFSFLWLVFGVGFSFASTANLSIIAKFYPSEVAWAVGLFDTFAGVGLMIGPVVGSMLYSLGNF